MAEFEKKSIHFMDHWLKDEMTITIKPGMGWCLWTDKGPAGPCAQSMDITMPWGGIMFFTDYDTCVEFIKNKKVRRGVQTNLLWGEVGSFGTGNVTLTVVERLPGESEINAN